MAVNFSVTNRESQKSKSPVTVKDVLSPVFQFVTENLKGAPLLLAFFLKSEREQKLELHKILFEHLKLTPL